SLASAGKLAVADTAIAILVAFTVNACSKVIAATITGDRVFAKKVTLGIVLQVAVLWLAWALF
ncbi:MAG: hypothetical protein VW395_08935, partial [Methylotenera sp.]